MLKFKNFLNHLAKEALKPIMLCNEKTPEENEII